MNKCHKASLTVEEKDFMMTEKPTWGNYFVIVKRDGESPYVRTASYGHLYSYLWSAKSFGVGKYYQKPTKENRYTYACIVDVHSGKIVWRNYD